jgi:nucleoside-diphosphate-sugar epimerase
MVQLLITGGLGFLGQQAARRFLRPNAALWSPVDLCFKPLSQLTLFDQSLPAEPQALAREIRHDPRVRVLTGDITEPGVTEELVDDPDISVIHLASMVSGDSEAREPATAARLHGMR